jgi:trimethylamine--corrinoid protein Co-methyltransferase
MGDFADRFRTRKRFDWLGREERQRIHGAALAVLEKTGMRVLSPGARQALGKAGANVDESAHVVRFPPDLVESLLAEAPRRITLAGRSPRFDLPMDGTHCYFTTDGCGIAVWDSATGTKRASLLEDVRRTAILGDFLPYVSIYEPMVVAHDVPEKAHVVAGMRAAMENTEKHLLTESTTNPDEARAQVKMAAEVLGSKEELLRRPYLSAMLCTTSPLSVDGNAMDAALVWAEHGVPIHITSMAQAGVSGPVTLAGDLVVCHAETLAVACAAEAHAPGAPVIYGSVLSGMDPRTGAYMGGSAESTLLAVGSIEMAKHVGLPCSVGGFGSSAKVPGTQASLENALITALCADVGGEVVNGLGTPAGSTLLSYEQLLLDHEIAGMVLTVYRGFNVDADTVALDLIQRVGIGGTYLGERHTLEHIREIYRPMLWDTDPFDAWVQKGRKEPMQVAREQVDRILREHRPTDLDPGVRARLDGIVKEFLRA